MPASHSLGIYMYINTCIYIHTVPRTRKAATYLTRLFYIYTYIYVYTVPRTREAATYLTRLFYIYTHIYICIQCRELGRQLRTWRVSSIYTHICICVQCRELVRQLRTWRASSRHERSRSSMCVVLRAFRLLLRACRRMLTYADVCWRMQVSKQYVCLVKGFPPNEGIYIWIHIYK
jgi:hypothetical protein